jgi:hypothetical protein
MGFLKLDGKKAWRFIGSVRVALVLFVVIIVISFTGAVLPEKYQPGIYYSRWFISILGLFCFNLLACSFSRIVFNRKRFFSTVTHISVLVIMAGALISFLASERGTIEFEEGQAQDSFISDKGKEVFFGFKVLLEDFSLKWYSPEDYKIRLLVTDKNIRKSFSAIQDKEYVIPGTEYRFSVIKYFPDFSLDENNNPLNNSEVPNNPAVLIRIISEKSKEERWLFSKHPKMSFGKDQNIKFIFDWEPMIKEFASTVKFTGADKERSAVIKVNHPALYKGYSFYQSGYDKDKPGWTALEVVKDPGVPIVFAGFVFLNIGIIAIYLQRLNLKNKKEGVK